MGKLSDIKIRGWKALVKHLGLADATMFVMEHEQGNGDYTKERKQMFRNKTAKDIAAEVKNSLRNRG